MAEARPHLVETDLSVEEVGRRVSYGDTGYFVRSFRRAHATTRSDGAALVDHKRGFSDYHNAYHNAERVDGGLRGLKGSCTKKNPRKWGLLGSCRTRIRT